MTPAIQEAIEVLLNHSDTYGCLHIECNQEIIQFAFICVFFTSFSEKPGIWIR